MKKYRLTIKLLAVLTALLLAIPACVTALAEGYDLSGAVQLEFADSGITVKSGSAAGCSIDGTALSITAGGTYAVGGSCADGSITVKKGVTGVILILNGLTLTSGDTAPITCNKSSGVTIVAAAGTVNTLTDSKYNNDDEYPDNSSAENAVIKCKDGSQVTLCGEGTLNIVANGKNGIKGGASTEEEGDAWLTIRELTLNVTANVNDGIKSDQELNILSGKITVSAADDGIKSDLTLNIGAECTDGPTIVISDCYEGVEAANINIYSGDITVHAQDDGMNAANSDLSGYAFSCDIYGGNIYIDAEQGDGIDSNGTLGIYGGNVRVFSSQQNDNSPLDSETGFTISGGTVLAVGSAGIAEAPRFAGQPYVVFGGMGGFGMRRGGAGVSVTAGSGIEILGADGASLISAAAPRAARYVFFSSPSLTDGETCTLKLDGAEAATSTATSEGGMGGFGQRPDGSGGFGGFGQKPDGQPPEIPDGEAQELPEGGFGERPDGNGSFGQRPDGSEGFGGFGQKPDGDLTIQLPENSGGENAPAEDLPADNTPEVTETELPAAENGSVGLSRGGRTALWVGLGALTLLAAAGSALLIVKAGSKTE